MRNLFLFIFILLMIGSCKKEEVDERTSIIRGQVVEYGTGKPLNGVLIRLEIMPGGMGLFNFVHDSSFAISDINGNYQLKYKPVIYEDIDSNYIESHSYRFELSKPNYIKKNCAFYTYSIYPSIPTDTIVNFKLEPESFIKLHVKNISPAEEGDIIRLHYNIDGIGRGAEYYGADIDTSYVIRTGGNRFQQFAISLYKNNRIERHYRDSIYCPAFKSVDYEILY